MRLQYFAPQGRFDLIQILHTADVHLDAPLRSLALRNPELRDLVRAATRMAFTTLVDTALDRNVAALLIAGDLFDGAQRSAKTAAFLMTQLDRLNAAHIPVFYIKGNHDALNPLNGATEFPPNVHVFDGRGGKVRIDGTDIWVHGVSFNGRHAPDSLLDKFAPPVPDATNIALLHTSLAGASGHDPYAPCALSDLQAMGFDYWALGHIHKRQIHSETPWIVMPGIPQGRDIGESGAKSATLITLNDRQITTKAVPTAAVEFRPVTTDISTTDSDAALRQHLQTVLQQAADELQAPAGLVRLRLTGHPAHHWQILRDSDTWAETAAELARDTGALWLEKLVLDLSEETTTQDANASALGEIAQLMTGIGKEDSFRQEAQATLDALLSQIPADQRARLVPDAEAAEALLKRLTHDGTLRALAAMRGAAS